MRAELARGTGYLEISIEVEQEEEGEEGGFEVQLLNKKGELVLCFLCSGKGEVVRGVGFERNRSSPSSSSLQPNCPILHHQLNSPNL